MLNLLLQNQRRRRGGRTLTSTLMHLGAVGLFFLAILDSSPLPTFGGLDILTAALAASHRNPWYEYAATATAGSIVGAYLTFRLARQAGSAYLDKKFKKGNVSRFLKLFKKWGTGTLVASTAIPLPTPTSMFFAAAGASGSVRGLCIVAAWLAAGRGSGAAACVLEGTACRIAGGAGVANRSRSSCCAELPREAVGVCAVGGAFGRAG